VLSPARTCASCGATFRRPPTLDGPYCSPACGFAARRQRNATTFAARFWSHVEKTDGCWLWTGTSTRGGYGEFKVATRKRPSHRIAWELVNGAIPAGLWVLHKCPGGSRSDCVNPAHLSLGGARENVDDRQREGRTPRGDVHARARLTAAQAHEIRRRYLPRHVTQDALAREFNVTQGTIWLVIHHKAWCDEDCHH
jgi:hypothetical protein